MKELQRAQVQVLDNPLEKIYLPTLNWHWLRKLS